MRVTPNIKRFTRLVTADTPILCRLKYWRGLSAVGAQVTVATVQVAANNLTFLINTIAETIIGTYTGNSGGDNQVVFVDAAPSVGTVGNLIDVINGLGPGHPVGVNLYRRMRASLGDWRPGWVIGNGDGLAAGPDDILLGDNSDGYEVLADTSELATADTLSVCIGGPTCRRGSGPQVFDHFESDYVTTTAGVTTPQRESVVQQERFDSARFQVVIDSIHAGMLHATNDKRIRVYDINDNLVWTYQLNALDQPPANILNENITIDGPMGSPLFVELDGSGGFTDGPLQVSGFIRVI